MSFHTVKPLDSELLKRVFSDFSVVATIEEHGILGGFGSSVSEWLVGKENMKASLLCLGVSDTFFCEAGKQEYARHCFGLTDTGIAKSTMEFFLRKTQK